MISYSNVFWLSLVAIVPVSFWLAFFRSNKKNPWNKNFLLTIFWFGVLSSLLAVFLELFYFENKSVRGFLVGNNLEGIGFFLSTLGTVIPVALIEEFSKGLVLIWAAARRKILSLQNGLLLGILVGLSFAVTENGIYFVRSFNEQQAIFSGNFWQVVFLRFVFSTSAHIIYSGFCGFYLAGFLKETGWEGKIKFLLKAIFFPVFIHTSFNFLLETTLGWAVFFIVLIGLGRIVFLYQKKENEVFFLEKAL